MMIRLMESIANDLIQSLLPAGFVTVGDEVRVEQKAPALSRTKVRAKSKLLEADGRKLLSDVCVMQDDKVIGEGLHLRTIVKVAG
jgi:fluoroacetyl-CoA thioesterase